MQPSTLGDWNAGFVQIRAHNALPNYGHALLFYTFI